MISATAVKDRLKNYAIKNGKNMQEVLTAYGLERTIYRISISKYKERFTLKGGILLYALFDGEFARATSDIDLLAKNISNNVDEMKSIFNEIFMIKSDDALRYEIDTLNVKKITEFKEYSGVNISIAAYLEKTRIQISIDIGFGDIVSPHRMKMDFPVILDMAVPEVNAYSLYSVIAEKFEAIVSLGDANSRYKDFYDIYILADRYSLSSGELRKAICKTFKHRHTGFDDIIAFEKEFAVSDLHHRRWEAFLKKKKAIIKIEFPEVLFMIKALLVPIVESIINDIDYDEYWDCHSKKWITNLI